MALVPNDALINVLRRKLGYSFKRPTDQTNIYKKNGGTHRIFVKKNAVHSPDYVRMMLRSASMPEDEIEQFLLEANT